MRVLVATVPGVGHILPLVPLARRLQESGAAVLWATASDQGEQLAADGFATVAVGPPMGVWFKELAARTRGRPGDGIPPGRSTHWFAPHLFGEVGTNLMVDELLACAREFQPDVLLFESRCYAAPVIARVVGALPVLHAVTTLLEPEVEVLVSEAVTPLWRELGLEAPSYAGVFDGLTISNWPASLDDPSPYGELVVHRLRPSATSAQAPPWLDAWISEQSSRSIVYATLGTVFGGNIPVLRAILDGLMTDGVAVLLTVGQAGDPDALGPLPPNARVERFVPQETVLQSCHAVVSHAGSGTTLGALAHGLPHIMLPQGADQFINADRCQSAGLGRTLQPRDAKAVEVRSALHSVLNDPSVQDNVRRVQAEMAAGLAMDDVVSLIQSSRDAAG
ncbi:MAG: glycosyltransferase [Candidatus Dormibacteria bacterium]